MKKTALFFIVYIITSPVYAITTEYSKFAEQCYAQKTECKNVHINVKKEYTTVYDLKMSDGDIYSITYGWGDMKVRHCKKQRITYTVLSDCSKKPYWSSITVYK